MPLATNFSSNCAKVDLLNRHLVNQAGSMRRARGIGASTTQVVRAQFNNLFHKKLRLLDCARIPRAANSFFNFAASKSSQTMEFGSIRRSNGTFVAAIVLQNDRNRKVAGSLLKIPVPPKFNSYTYSFQILKTKHTPSFVTSSLFLT